jgi:hypothetical protein
VALNASLAIQQFKERQCRKMIWHRTVLRQVPTKCFGDELDFSRNQLL